MFSRIIRHQSQLPLRALINKRYFAPSGFVYSEKKDGENKGNDNNSADNKQNNNETDDPNKQSNTVKGNQDKSQDKHQDRPQDETVEQQKTEPSLEDQLKECTTKYKSLQESYLRSLADQENLRQRTTREVSNAKEFGIQKFAKDILDSIDILGMALNSVPKEFQQDETCIQKDSKEVAGQLVNLYKGVSMTETELQKTLRRHGVERDDPIDQVFDPNKHEAVFQTAIPDKKAGTIFSVQKVGYLLKNRVLRPAQVGVVAEA
ncbi:GrpE-domain-containing protein [Helicostylum pulchrum]|nr:GrpE-domain-containing protein [Helicostylum pulchrum]